MADIFITAIAGICVAAMAALGVYVSFMPLPPNDSHQPFFMRRAVWVSAVFLLLTVVIVGLSAIQTYRNGKQQADLAGTLSDVRGTLRETQTQLQTSALSQEFMKGQLSGLSMMVGKMNSDGGADSANLARALHQIGSEQSHPSGVEPPAIQRMTNQQLRLKVVNFVNALRKECNDYMTQDELQSMATMQKFTQQSKEERDKEWQEESNRTVSQGNSFNFRLREQYVGDSTIYRDELLRRLGPQDPSLHKDTWWMQGGIVVASYWQALGTADYLEQLAKRLPK